MPASAANRALFDRQAIGTSCLPPEGDTRVAQPTQPSRLIDSIIFWVLGSALFIVIALVPAVLLSAYFWDGLRVHYVVVPTSLVIVLLLWAASVFRTNATD